jgi:hypothetical protein
MDKQEWKSFFAWLDSASLKELRERHQKLIELLKLLQDPAVRSDAKRMLRHIEQQWIDGLNGSES